MTTIFELADKADVDGIREMLATNPAARDLHDEQGRSPLLRAAFAGRGPAFEAILEAGEPTDPWDRLIGGCADGLPAPDAWSPDGFTPLHLAAFVDNVPAASALLEAGADPNATADMYGAPATTMAMLLSSCHPAQAGVQSALAETLLDAGAAIEGALMTALSYGYLDVARTLVRRGARVDSLPAAAGLGRLDDAARMLPSADAEERHRALALAALHGHVDVVRMLLDAGEDPNRYNPKGNHAHSTPLHQAVLAGHEAVVRLLVERGARLDIKDTVYGGTPLGWAIYGKQDTIARHLQQASAP